MAVRRLLVLLVVSLGLLGLAVVLSYAMPRADRVAAQQAPEPQRIPVPLDVIRIRVSLGARASATGTWSGAVVVEGGELLRIRPIARAEVDGNRWKGTAAAVKRKKQRAVQAVVLDLLLRGHEGTRIKLDTSRGEYTFAVGDIARIDAERSFERGAVVVRRLPSFDTVASDADEEDYPTAVRGPDGTIWCAYVAYRHGNPIDFQAVQRGEFESLVTRGNGDQIKLAYYRDDVWHGPIDVTEAGRDVWKPTVAVDGQGAVWVIWSENVQGNWDIYARRFDPKSSSWSETVRLTDDPGSDINVVAVTRATDGTLWCAWQGFRGDNFDVFLARVTPQGAADLNRVSTSDSNDWYPDLAAAPNGDLYVAWDTYAAGNYDVYLRCLKGEELLEPVLVAGSVRYEGRPSVAVDKEGRVWVAFEDSDPNWGKDYGDRWPGKKGVPFYWTRNIIVRCVADGKVWQTLSDFRSDPIFRAYDDPKIQPTYDNRMSIPELCVDGAGRVWLFFRRHPSTRGGREIWLSYATYYSGGRWSDQYTVPNSSNTLDRRPAVVPLDNRLLLIYSSDHRAGGPRNEDNDLVLSSFPLEGDAPAPKVKKVDPTVPSEYDPVHPQEAEQVKRIRSYRISVGGKTYQLLRGEFHRHTEISAHRDWDGPFEELWRYAYDVARMDWIGPGDHDYGYAMQREYNWWFTQKQIDMYHNPPHFVPMFTYERSVVYPSGHRNVMFAERGVRTLPRLPGRRNLFGTPETGSPDVQNLYRYLKHFDGICAVHTSATNMGTDWRDNDPEVEPVVEIFQGHRQNYEEPNAPLAPKGPDDAIQGYHLDGFVWNALAKGYRLGFQSSSDHVSTHISYAIVLAEERSRCGVLEAFKKRHCYAAQDNIILDVRCGDHLMGDSFSSTTAPALRIRAIGTDRIARVDIVRQTGKELPHYVYAFEPGEQTIDVQWQDKDARPGTTYMYYVRIQQADKKLAWSSPIWVRLQGAGD